MSRSLLWQIEDLLNLLNNYLGIKQDDNDKSVEDKFGDILISENESIAKRMRTCFELKAINNESAIDNLNRGLLYSSSALLKHEIAYVLGQMRNKYAVKYLINVLDDIREETIVRHECCEALGAIADISTIPIIEKYLNDSSIELAETAELALQCIKMAQSNDKIARSKYNSIDPAPSFKELTNVKDIEKLKNIYLNNSNNLFVRYRAMFTLRDIGNDECVKILCKGLNDKSALFRHEVAFVLGQLMNENGINELNKVLSNNNESEMVRHEAAEALGSIAKDSCKQIINLHLNDKQTVVKESCIVAKDMSEFWSECQ